MLLASACGGGTERSFDRAAAIGEVNGGNANVGYLIVDFAEEMCLTLDDDDYAMQVAVGLDSEDSASVDIAEAAEAGCTR